MAHKNTLLKGLLLYLTFIIYGSLVPFDFHMRSFDDALLAFSQTPYLQLEVISRADLIANFVLYVPLGFFAGAYFLRIRRSKIANIFLAIILLIACSIVAIGVEFTQLYFRPRTVSLNDLSVEILGAFFGLVFWKITSVRLSGFWQQIKGSGLPAVKALLFAYLAAYLLLSLFPFDFLISASELSWKLNTNYYHLILSPASCTSAPDCIGKLSVDILGAVPIGILLCLIFPQEHRGRLRNAVLFGFILGITIELLQFLIASGISQGISVLARMLGMIIGTSLFGAPLLLWINRAKRNPYIKSWVLVTVLGYFILIAWLVWSGKGGWLSLESGLARMDKVQLLPFYYHYFTSEAAAVTNLLYYVALYFPLGIACWIWHLPTLHSTRGNRLIITGLLSGLAASGIEFGKLFLVNTHPDPTNALIAVFSAVAGYMTVNWIYSTTTSPTNKSTPFAEAAVAPVTKSGGRAWAILAGVFLTLLMIIGIATTLQSPIERLIDESFYPKLPTPDELSTPYIAGFQYTHPRLPAPSASDTIKLQLYNPGYLRNQRKRAKEGHGHFHASTLMAYIEPGSQDLDVLYQRLMDLEFTWRGHQQTKPIAVAYDWLYNQWSEQQRVQLRNKLVEGCNYQIELIRNDRLSPYNVYLYNSPFQALIACAIALYGDDPRGEPVMAFTYDLWKNRILPVWRQVMGHNGGWHETGGYIAVAVGQAAYQVPAMWRAATGEDLFRTEPGIKGLLDFLIYRIRPDGTHFRWGDSSFFDRKVPDRLPLALEYHHVAAYSLHGKPKKLEPTSWPWGPLTDDGLYDPSALSQMPLTKYFDGIGMIVARSDWSPDATYVTFKAGDNFWSHSHLDQGAFTIYKGGALAIDSGLYGPKYGSDHHMNYTYQTVAHNTVTVTDPNDTQPMPHKEKSPTRPIANDGGQRRVGSGWGKPAPLDLTEWLEEYETYHTGTMNTVFMKDEIVAAVADLTSAYTNKNSGEGTFADRTNRVENFKRFFAYDRKDDVIVIFDTITSTNPGFIKRWLLHTIEKPITTPGRFTAFISPTDKKGHKGGRLDGHVLLPEQPYIQTIGGPGLQFYVDGKNYDEGGKIADIVRKRRQNKPEPGAWRIEIIPSREALNDHFLVVLLPTIGNKEPSHKVKLLRDGDKVGLSISGPQRMTTWWFSPNLQNIDIKIIDEKGERNHHIATH